MKFPFPFLRRTSYIKNTSWDVVVFYFHPHGKEDTISYYGTPGTAAKLLGLYEGSEKNASCRKGCFGSFQKICGPQVSLHFLMYILSYADYRGNEKRRKRNQIWPFLNGQVLSL